MRRKLTTLLLVLVLGLMLAACGAPPSQTPAVEDGSAGEAAPAAEGETEGGDAATEPEPTATPIVAEAGTGDIQLIYWNGLTGSDGATRVQMVEAFAADIRAACAQAT